MTIREEIEALKRERRAVVLAHYYQEPEIQEIADAIGDSLELARRARDFDGDLLAFCGVRFMAETAKVLNPARAVIMPDGDASCSLVESCSANAVREYRRLHPQTCIVAYINTSVEVKAESDILCTSRNAVAVVESVPAETPILFLPDANLGEYVRRQTRRENLHIWQGNCFVHATFSARRLSAVRMEHPEAKVAAHPECPSHVLAQTDFIGSTSAIVGWCARHPAREFIIMTESGIRHALEQEAPHKRFHFVPNEQCNCSECPYMRMNTLEKLRDCLLTRRPSVELPTELMERARVPLERMLALS